MHASNFCSYYQAHVIPKEAWFLVAILKSFDHVAFDRAIEHTDCIFEFFVPPAQEDLFVSLMEYFLNHGVITQFEKKENRLLDPSEQF